MLNVRMALLETLGHDIAVAPKRYIFECCMKSIDIRSSLLSKDGFFATSRNSRS